MKEKKDERKVVHIEIDNETVKMATDYVRMVGMGDLFGMTLIGPAGCGKTHLVRHVLEDLGVPYVVFGGHISLAGTYEFLFEHRDELIFFDDVSQVINQVEIMEMLKQALNTGGHKRILRYRAKNVLNPDVKNNFEFTGRIIFAFNTADTQNPNVKAIFDRAPVVELKYSRKDMIDAMYAIAKGDGNGLLEYEKMIVTKEIEDYTDASMDISLRKQQLAFRFFKNFKKVHGEGNTLWKSRVHGLFGKKKHSWIYELLKELVGDGAMKRSEFAKQVAIVKNINIRTAQRRINDGLEMEELFENKMKGGDVSIKPFTLRK